jgi:hypothetical protein
MQALTRALRTRQSSSDWMMLHGSAVSPNTGREMVVAQLFAAKHA